MERIRWSSTSSRYALLISHFFFSNNTSRSGQNKVFLAYVHSPISAIVPLLVHGLDGTHSCTGMPGGKSFRRHQYPLSRQKKSRKRKKI